MKKYYFALVLKILKLLKFLNNKKINLKKKYKNLIKLLIY